MLEIMFSMQTLDDINKMIGLIFPKSFDLRVNQDRAVHEIALKDADYILELKNPIPIELAQIKVGEFFRTLETESVEAIKNLM